MGRVEYEALVIAESELLEEVEDDTAITVEFIFEMHRRWLGTIYPFAGQRRQVDLTAPPQGDVPEFRFAHAGYLEANLAKFESDQLKRLTPCHEENMDVLPLHLAEVQAEFIMLHPFREGNGRIARWITDLMSLQAGRPLLDYDFEGEDGLTNRAAYYKAMHIALVKMEYEPLAQIIREAILRAE